MSKESKRLLDDTSDSAEVPTPAGFLNEAFKDLPTGFESITEELLKIPFVRILQDLSPEVKKNKPEYMPNAEPGLFLNTITREITDSIEGYVLRTDSRLLVWKPNRGGFVSSHPYSELRNIVSVTTEKGEMFTSDGNEVKHAINFFMLDKNLKDFFVLSLTSTSLKYAKEFITRMKLLSSNGKPVPMFGAKWNISTVVETNQSGSWYTVGRTPKVVDLVSTPEEVEAIKAALKILDSTTYDFKDIEGKPLESESRMDV